MILTEIIKLLRFIYIDHLQVSEKERSTSFRFGNENSVKSGKTMAFTAKIGKKNIVIKTYTINIDLPLL